MPARSRPAALPLASWRQISPQPHRKSARATLSSRLQSRNHAISSTRSHYPDRCQPIPVARSTHPNPHSARGTLGCPTHRDFVPWRFSDAGRHAAWMGRHAGVRKPAQQRKCAKRRKRRFGSKPPGQQRQRHVRSTSDRYRIEAREERRRGPGHAVPRRL